MSVSGEGTVKNLEPSMNINLADKAVAPTDRGLLAVQYWLALGNGGYDNAYYKVIAAGGETEWILLASRGNGVSSADSGTQTSLTNSGYDGASMGVVRANLDLKEYGNQAVSVILAVVPNGAAELEDKYLVFASFTNVAVPTIDERPALEEIYFGASIKVNSGSANTPSTKNGAITVTGASADANCQINLNGWCAVDGGVYKYVWSADGGESWNEDFVNSDRIKTPTSDDIVNAGQSYSGKTFSNLESAKTNAQFQSGGISIDLSAYAKQTVDIIFAAIPVVNQDVKIILVTINGVSCPAAVSDAYFGASVKVNDGTAQTPSTSKGAITVTGTTVDENNLIKIGGWCSVDGGISKYVWSVDGINWHDVDLTLVTGDYVRDVTGSEVTAVPTAAQSYAGKTFTDLEGAVTNARFVIHIDLSEYAGSTVSVTFAAVPVKDADKVTPMLTIKDVAVPSAE